MMLTSSMHVSVMLRSAAVTAAAAARGAVAVRRCGSARCASILAPHKWGEQAYRGLSSRRHSTSRGVGIPAAASAPQEQADDEQEETAAAVPSSVDAMSVEEPPSFQDLGVDPLLVAGLAEGGIEVPSPIQESAIPVLLRGSNAAIQSYTGSGKTLAYLLPALTLALQRAEAAYRRRQQVLSAAAKAGSQPSFKEEDLWTVQVLVVAPSQELAIQISRVAQSLLPNDSRSAVQQAIGGANLRRQADAIAEHQPLMVVGTPGRVVDLVRTGVLRLHRCPLLILDEADQLLGDVYAQHMTTIVQHCGKRLASSNSSSSSDTSSSDGSSGGRQTVLVSATLWAGGLARFASWCPEPQFVTMGQAPTWSDEDLSDQGGAAEPSKTWGWGAKGWDGPASMAGVTKTQGSVGGPEGQGLVPTLPPNLEHMYIVVNPERKSDVLRRAMHALELNMGLGFMNWQQRLKDMAAKVAAKKIEVGSLHGELLPTERGTVLDAARAGAYRLLLVSDLAARGLDLPQVDAVFNLELPSSAAHYAHRAGRTGRMGARGLVVTLVAPGERFVVERLSKRLGVPIMECHLAGGQLVLGPPPKQDKKKKKKATDVQQQDAAEDVKQQQQSMPAQQQQKPTAAAAAGKQQRQQESWAKSAAAAMIDADADKRAVADDAAKDKRAAGAAAGAGAAAAGAAADDGEYLLDEEDDLQVEGDEPWEAYRQRIRKELEAELEEIHQERRQRHNRSSSSSSSSTAAAASDVAADAEEGQGGGQQGRQVRQKAASSKGIRGTKGTPAEAAALAMAAIEADETSRKARAKLPPELLSALDELSSSSGSRGGSSRGGGSKSGGRGSGRGSSAGRGSNAGRGSRQPRQRQSRQST